MRVKLNGHEGILHRPHGGNTLGRQDVQHLREFIARGRVTPSLYEAGKKRVALPRERRRRQRRIRIRRNDWTKHRVAVLVGSLRKESLNRKMAQALIAARAGRRSRSRSSRSATCRSTTRTTKPIRRPPCATFRRRDRARPTPCCSSRPNTTARCLACSRMRSTSDRAPTARASGAASRRRSSACRPGAIGGFGANHHLRQSLVFLNVPRDAAARGLHRRRRQDVRRPGRAHQRIDARLHDEIHAGVRGVDRAHRR